MLDIARIQSGKLQLDRQTVDLRALVADTLQTCRQQIDQRQQSLHVELGEEPVLIEGDPVRLAQVISNLVDNAAKYTPEKGRISVTLACEGDQVLFVVDDTGQGVPPESARKIFEPFMQLPRARYTSDGGLGLGLALVKRLTELHGGEVSVVSDGPDRGSTFTIRLNRGPRPTRAEASSPPKSRDGRE